MCYEFYIIRCVYLKYKIHLYFLSVNQLSQLTKKMSVLNKIIKKSRKSYSQEIKERILKDIESYKLLTNMVLISPELFWKIVKKKQEIIDIYCIYKVIN